MTIFSALVLSAFALGCADDPAPAKTTPAKDAGFETSDLCPSADDARVHYRDKDPNACSNITLDCTTDQNGFDNACGCGCIDKGDPLCPPVVDPAITWTSHDPAECGTKPPICPLGETAFNSSCGCGCTRPGE